MPDTEPPRRDPLEQHFAGAVRALAGPEPAPGPTLAPAAAPGPERADGPAG